MRFCRAGQSLVRMAEHIAASLAIEPGDFETSRFGQQGSLGRAHTWFGDALGPLMAELNERRAASTPCRHGANRFLNGLQRFASGW